MAVYRRSQLFEPEITPELIDSILLRLTDLNARVAPLESAYSQLLARLAALETSVGSGSTIFNTLAGSLLPGSQVEGFLSAANDLDDRLTALGY